jgi:DNA-directed RNA polymerase subunit N (RpoN/RPB10)
VLAAHELFAQLAYPPPGQKAYTPTNALAAAGVTADCCRRMVLGHPQTTANDLKAW